MWREEIRGGLRATRRRWFGVLTLASLSGVACVVLSFALSDVLSQTQLLVQGAALRNANAVTFQTFYKPVGITAVPPDTVAQMGRAIDERRAYTAVLYNTGTDDPATTTELGLVVLLFGAGMDDLFPNLGLCSPAPCMMHGAKVPPGQLDSYTVAGMTVPDSGQLPAGATFFDTNAAGFALDRHVVVRLPSSALPVLGPGELEEATTRMVLLDPPLDQTDAFVASAARAELYLVPQWVATEQSRRFRDTMVMSSVYVVGMSAFLALVLMTFAASMRVMVRTEARGFAIRRVYGAGRAAVAIRSGVFLACAVLAAPAVLVLPLAAAGGPFGVGARWVLMSILVVFAASWALMYRGTLRASEAALR